MPSARCCWVAFWCIPSRQATDRSRSDCRGRHVGCHPKPRKSNQVPNGILSLAAAESESGHPVAKALICVASRRRLELPDASGREEFPGRGVRAKSGEDVVLVGNYEFMVSNDVNPSYFKTKSENFANEGKTVLYVARNGKLQGIVALENTFRPGTEDVVRRLRRCGVREIHLISGDRGPVIEKIGPRSR